MNTYKLPISVVLAFLFAGVAAAQQIQRAPLNPAWIRHQEESHNKLMLPRTADGHGLGLIPSVQYPAPLRLMNRTKSSLRAGQPAAYDLRTLGKLTPVKDQGAYGTCWAFATFGSMESCLLPAETWDFSENNLANLSGFDYGFDGGGTAWMSLAYLTRWDGPVNDSSDPYPNEGGSPAGLPVPKHVQNAKIFGLDFDAIKQAVMDNGAVYTTMYWSDTYYNSSHHSYYCNGSPEYGNHAVAIVGWDDAYSRTNFNTAPSQDGAFIIRNSWGSGWGEGGYFYASYADAVLASEGNFSFYNAESTTNYSVIYQYDPLGDCGDWGWYSLEGWVANIFTSTNNGHLVAVSTYAVDYDTQYAIYIYTNPLTNQPASGTLQLAQTGTWTDPGYYTVPLNARVSLAPGERFSIVIKLVASSYIYPMPAEFFIDGYSSRATASAGQSFMSPNGQTWTDTFLIYTNMNVCVKGFVEVPPPTGSLQFNSAVYNVDEGASSATLTVTREDGSLSNATVQYATRDGSAVAGRDYVATNGTLAWQDGESAAKTIVVPILTGTAYEPQGVFAVDLSNATGASLGTPAAAQVSILAPPTNMSASSILSDKVQLTWSPVAGATRYEIYRNTANNPTGLAVYASTTAAAYDDTAAAVGTIYFYWLKTVFPSSRSDFSAGVSGYRALAAPAALTVSAGLYTDKIRATWNAVAGASSYKIWRSTNAASASAVLLAEIIGTTNDDTSVSSGINYYYWVSSKKWQPAGIMTSALSMAVSGWRRSKAATDNGRGDYDGDNRFDPAVYHRATGTWLIMLSASGYRLATYYLGGEGFAPIPGDYDGDGLTDVAVYHEASGLWTALLSSGGNTPVSGVLGGTGYRAQPRDFDGDGKTDLAVYQLSTGTWKVLLSRNRYLRVEMPRWLGGAGYNAVSADYDGDGRADPAVYQITAVGQGVNALWQVRFSSAGYYLQSWLSWASGLADESAAPADYDGDGNADAALYNPALSTWNIWPSSIPVSLTLGDPGCVPVPGDYDADGQADPAVYQEATGEWTALISGDGYAPVSAMLGGPGYEAARPAW